MELTPEALDLLIEYDWPGNVRELENVIERAVVLSSGIPDRRRPRPRSRPQQPPRSRCRSSSCRRKASRSATSITDFEKRLIESTLEAAGGVQKRAAELLHIKPTTLNEMIKRHDIRPRRKKAANGTSGSRPVETPDVDDEEEAVTVDHE